MTDVGRYRNLAKGDRGIFEDLIAPPYAFTLKYLQKFHEISQNREMRPLLKESLGEKDIENLEEQYNLIFPALNIDINQTLRLVELEEDLINLVKYTDNRIFHRPLFFPTVFINNNIEYDEAIIKGILISEAITHGEDQQLIYGDLFKEYGKDANDYAISFIAIDTKTKVRNITLISLTTEEKIKPSMDEKTKRAINLDNFIRNMVVNIVDMVEETDRDLSVTTIASTKEENLKRIRKKQIPFPTKVYIKARGEFKQYIKKFNEDILEGEEYIKKGKIPFKFMIRGHWRHFRAERYREETKARPIWIKPFWKGEGIPIAKEYKLVH
jgi:hypothetical protein